MQAYLGNSLFLTDLFSIKPQMQFQTKNWEVFYIHS